MEEDETCRRFAHLLNFEDQADRLVREVQQGLPGFSITLTGHSMGGHLAESGKRFDEFARLPEREIPQVRSENPSGPLGIS